MASIMEMSDEDLAKLTDSEVEALIAQEEQEAPEQEETTTEEETPDEQAETTAEEDESEETPEPDEESEGEQGEDAKPAEATAEDGAGKASEGEPAKTAQPDTPPPERDYKAEVAKVLAPFKANGRQIQVDTVDDAIQLMQQGANYHKKMEGLKPRLATLKLLEREGLLDGDKLNFLIDLAKGDKGAINKLVNDHSLDALDIDASKADQYKSTHYQVSEAEVEMDNVLGDLKESPHYSNLLDTVGNKWDNASHKQLADKPSDLRDIHRHMELGVFDAVQDRVATERALGKLNGLSSLDAYRTVGERMYREGQFNDNKQVVKSAPTKVAAVVQTPKAPVNEESKKKKLAASPSGTKSVVKVEEDFDPLNMSDEDFIKHQAKFKIR